MRKEISKWSGFYSRLMERLGLRPETSLAERTFVIVCLCFITICLVAMTVNFLLQLSLWLNVAILLCLLGTLALLRDWLHHPERPPRAMSLMLLGLLTLAATWFPNGGYHSSGPLYYFPLAILAAVMLNQSRLMLFLILMILELLGLCALELWFPDWVQTYSSPDQALIDILISVALICVSMSWCVHLLVKSYNQERQHAIDASRAKSVFLSQMSHELRTPLNAVIGFSGQLLERGGSLDPAKQRLYLKRVRANGEHLLALVNQILDLSRIEAGHLELFWQQTDLQRLLAEVTELMELLARDKGLRLKLELPECLPALRTDPTRLRQILINLLGNAVKFTEQGSITCRLQIQALNLRIEIQDTGPGIPPDRREAIFEPFVRLTGAAQMQGSGMGLPITRFLCEKMGYQLELHDAPGGGSLFVLILPLDALPLSMAESFPETPFKPDQTRT